jgi:hypothetical protein
MYREYFFRAAVRPATLYLLASKTDFNFMSLTADKILWEGRNEKKYPDKQTVDISAF